MCLAAIQQRPWVGGKDMSIETEAMRAYHHPQWAGLSLETLEGFLVFWLPGTGWLWATSRPDFTMGASCPWESLLPLLTRGIADWRLIFPFVDTTGGELQSLFFSYISVQYGVKGGENRLVAWRVLAKYLGSTERELCLTLTLMPWMRFLI